MSKPTRFTPMKGNKLDPDKCVASVHNEGRWPGFHQCRNKRKKGTEWCGVHTYVEPTEDSELLWVVEADFWSPCKAKLISLPILKETPKRITVTGAGSALGYKNTIPVQANGTPRHGSRTRAEALRRHQAACASDLKIAEEQVVEAKKALNFAEKLLKKG